MNEKHKRKKIYANEMKYKRYKVVGCPKCNCIQMSDAAKVMKCKRCQRSTTVFKKDGTLGIRLYGHYDHPHMARQVCTIYKGKVESGGELKYEGDEQWEKEQLKQN